jgi:replicative DNA helicase
MIDPLRSIDECVSRLGEDGDQVFYDLRHQTIYRTLLEMSLLGKTIDVVLLQQHLKDKQLLEQIGGIAYLAVLPDSAPSAANIGYYLGILEEKYKLRRMIQVCTKVVGDIFDNEGQVNELLDEAEKQVMSVRSIAAKPTAVPIRDAVKKAVATLDDFHNRSGMLIGIPSGFSDFDKMTGGLLDAQMIVIAGRPSLGKTSFCMNIVEHVGLEYKLPVGVFSLEMTTDSLTLRMLCSRARVNMRTARDGFLAERDFPKLTGAAGKLLPAPIYIDDTSGLSIMDLRSRARRMVNNFGIKLFVIDYLQLLFATMNGRRIDKREREVSEISLGIKSLAKELNVPIIAISQLNRSMEKERRKPNLSDLRESGSLEQDADVVGLLYNSGKTEEDDSGTDCVPVNLYIAKQRNGPTGDVNLIFLKSYTRFETAARVSDEDSPDQRDFGYRV